MKHAADYISEFKKSISLKLFVIGFLVLILLIPAGMIRNLIRERESLMQQVTEEVTSKWGNEQTLAGPFMVIPYHTMIEDDNEIVKVKNYLHVLPESLVINGKMHPEERYRGIYKVIVYNSGLNFSGSFVFPNFSEIDINENDILWDEVVVNAGIPDMRGINHQIVFQLGESEFIAQPGIKYSNLIQSGINFNVGDIYNKNLDFQFNIDLNGGKGLYFYPLGKTTKATLSSSWESPSFTGAFLPDDRNVDNTGFTADWKILQLNRNYPQAWKNSEYNFNGSEFGVELIVPVNHYQKTMRSVKYAIMFIILTFLTFFFIELLKKKPVHPVQYLLVGISLIVFYSLLLSLTEHISFLWSYIIAASTIFILITFYAYSILKNIKTTAILSSILIIIYMFLYTLLQLMDYALLMGNIGLVIILAVIMYFSRKVNWYKEELPDSPTPLRQVE